MGGLIVPLFADTLLASSQSEGGAFMRSWDIRLGAGSFFA